MIFGYLFWREEEQLDLEALDHIVANAPRRDNELRIHIFVPEEGWVGLLVVDGGMTTKDIGEAGRKAWAGGAR